jgi:hypothetical protein
MPDKPPIFKSWNGWYITVLIFLLLQIMLFQLFTKYFS